MARCSRTGFKILPSYRYFIRHRSLTLKFGELNYCKVANGRLERSKSDLACLRDTAEGRVLWYSFSPLQLGSISAGCGQASEPTPAVLD